METKEIKTLHGFKILMDERQAYIGNNALHEPETTKAIYESVKPGMHVVEAGANYGYHALNLMDCIKENGKLYIFEANPDLIDLIHKNMKNNGFDNYELFNQGLSDGESMRCFYPVTPGEGRFIKTDQCTNPNIMIPTTSLDIFCKDKRIDFIRMDIEGLELAALKGGVNTLTQNNIPIILEHTEFNNPEEESLEMFDVLQSMKYSMYRITDSGYMKIKERSEFRKKYVEGNTYRDILCLKNNLNI